MAKKQLGAPPSRSEDAARQSDLGVKVIALAQAEYDSIAPGVTGVLYVITDAT